MQIDGLFNIFFEKILLMNTFQQNNEKMQLKPQEEIDPLNVKKKTNFRKKFHSGIGLLLNEGSTSEEKKEIIAESFFTSKKTLSINPNIKNVNSEAVNTSKARFIQPLCQEENDKSVDYSKSCNDDEISFGFINAREQYRKFRKPKRFVQRNIQSNEFDASKSSAVPGLKKRRYFVSPARIDDTVQYSQANHSQIQSIRVNGKQTSGNISSLESLPISKPLKMALSGPSNQSNPKKSQNELYQTYMKEPKLQTLDPVLIERIETEVLQKGDPICFDDIAGLSFAKNTIEEIVVWPLQNPELYTGYGNFRKASYYLGHQVLEKL